MKNSKTLTVTLTLATLLIAGNALARTSPTIEFNPAIKATPMQIDPSVKPIELPTIETTTPTVELPDVGELTPVPLPNIDPEALDPEENEPKDHKKKLARLLTGAIKRSALSHVLKDVGETMEADDKAKLDETVQGVLELQPGSFRNKKGGLKDGPKAGHKPAGDVEAEDTAEVVE